MQHHTTKLQYTVFGNQSREGSGHDLLGNSWVTRHQHTKVLEIGTMLHECIICTISQQNLVQHTHRSGYNRVCVLTKL